MEMCLIQGILVTEALYILILQWMKSFPPLIIPLGYSEAILVQINLYGYWNRLIKTSFKPQQQILI